MGDAIDDPPWLEVALAELGQHELSGSASNPRIVEYLQTTTLERRHALQDETPWCSAFVGWCLAQAGVEGTRSALARSWLDWGRPLSQPRRGAITVLYRQGGAHVGFWMEERAGELVLLGGNQADAVSVRAFDRSRLIAYRYPRAW